MKKEKFPSLKNLLAGPFYQCWYEYDDRPAENILKESIDESSFDEIRKVLNEVDKILNSKNEMKHIKDTFSNDIGCNYNPEEDGISYLEWLDNIRFESNKKLNLKNQ